MLSNVLNVSVIFTVLFDSNKPFICQKTSSYIIMTWQVHTLQLALWCFLCNFVITFTSVSTVLCKGLRQTLGVLFSQQLLECNKKIQ